MRRKIFKPKFKGINYSIVTIFIYRSAKMLDEKELKEDYQTVAELSAAHRHLQPKSQLSTNQLH